MSNNIPSVLQVESAEFRRAVGLVKHAMHKRESRPNLRGIHVSVRAGSPDGGVPDRLLMEATDGHRLARAEINGKWGGAAFDCTMPADQLPYLFNGDLRLQRSADAGWTLDNPPNAAPAITLRNLGAFPNLDAVIPEASGEQALFALKALQGTLQRALMQAAVRQHPHKLCALTFAQGCAELRAQRTSAGQLRVDIPRLDQGSAVNESRAPLGFNARYLLDVLRALPRKGSIALQWAGESKPVRITCPEAPGFVALLMPVRLHDWEENWQSPVPALMPVQAELPWRARAVARIRSAWSAVRARFAPLPSERGSVPEGTRGEAAVPPVAATPRSTKSAEERSAIARKAVETRRANEARKEAARKAVETRNANQTRQAS